MTFFAIRKKGTDMFLPQHPRKRGHTHQEPSAERPPRLFPKEAHAKCALSCWASGKWRDSSYMDSYTGEWEYEGPIPVRGTERNKSDMEIVKVEVRVR